MNHPGETAELAAIAMPTIGVINNAQREHQEFMKSVADVAAEHAALISALPERGIVVINADDDYASFWQEVVVRRNAEGAALVLRDFGCVQPAVVTARFRIETWGSVVEVTTPEGNVKLDLRVPGRHNVANALAAIAAATAAGAGIGDAAARHSRLSGRCRDACARWIFPAAGRSSTIRTTPIRIRCARQSPCLRARPHRAGWCWATWAKSATRASPFHREVGAYARAAGVDRLLAVGDLAQHAVAAFGVRGRAFLHDRGARRRAARRARA